MEPQLVSRPNPTSCNTCRCILLSSHYVTPGTHWLRLNTEKLHDAVVHTGSAPLHYILYSSGIHFST